MLGYTSGFDKSMNGIRTLTDGISIITDGTASHENIIYSDFMKSETNETIILKDTITTENLNASITTTTDLNSSNVNSTNIECDYFNVNNLSNILEDTFVVNGNTNNIINNGITTFNNTVNIVNKNMVQTQSGTIQQTGTGTNNFKDTNINGSLVLGSNFTQTGGSSSVKDITTDNITMRTNKGISQTGPSISNSFGTTSITNLVITDSVSFPSTVTIPGTTTTDDILMEGDSVITQDITTSTTKFNKFRYSKFLDIDIDGDINQVKGGANATLKNTTIEGTAEIQGDITQTTGSTILKTINCDNITLNINNSINQSGTGFLNQSGTGTNQMKAINLLSNNNLIFNGTGIIDQPVNGINLLSNSRFNGYSIFSGRNNTTNGATQNITNNQGLHLQFGRVSSDGTSYIMNHKGGATGNGSFKFQRYNGSGVYIDEPITIGDTTQINNNTIITGSLSASSLGTIGAIDNTEFQKLNGLIIPGTIQDKFNDLDTTINNLQTTTGNNNTALTGISYNTSTDTTLIDNNLTIPSGKNLLLGTTNVLNNINTANTNITNLQNITDGITYNSTTDTTTIDNNLTINKNLVVQGMNIKSEIDALETSFTTGTINSTGATITTLNTTNINNSNNINSTDITVSNLIQSYFFRSRDTNDDTKNFLLYQSGNITNYDHRVWGGEARLVNYDISGNQVVGMILSSSSALFNVVVNCANIVVSAMATILNLVVSNITSPSGQELQLTSATGQNLQLNANHSGVGNVVINGGTTNGNTIIANGNLSVNAGSITSSGNISCSGAQMTAFFGNFQNIFLTDIYARGTAQGIQLKTSIRTDENRAVQSPATYFGVWMIDHALDDSYLLNSFQPVPSSVAVAGNRDDAWIVAAGYVVVLYRYARYEIIPGARPWTGTTDNNSQTRVLNNQDGTTFLCLASTDIYGTANQVGSCRVFYRGVEVTIPWLTYPPSTPPEFVPPYLPFWV